MACGFAGDGYAGQAKGNPFGVSSDPMNFMDKNFIQQACQLLSISGEDWSEDKIHITPLTPDGSLRRFCRMQHQNGRKAVAIAPPPDDATVLREAISGWHIGRHLLTCKAPVPELYGFDEQSGLLICEDLGNQRLHDLVQQGKKTEQVMHLYRQTVTELARMQVQGCAGFDVAWCWDTPQYDRTLMMERESGYFLQALCQNFLQLDIDKEKITLDFKVLAGKVSQAQASFFLHRDFQSRNIMVHQDQVYFIDYQAGRLGPLAYDLASLLIDPYAALSASMQEELLDHYFIALTSLLPYDREQFQQEYLVLALQRNLQILGAFAFLSQQRKKPFFRQYLAPALKSLQTLLAKTASAEYAYLKKMSRRCSKQLKLQFESSTESSTRTLP